MALALPFADPDAKAMPSIYQLLPRGADYSAAIDVDTWDENRWRLLPAESDQCQRWLLPDVHDASVRRKPARVVAVDSDPTLERAQILQHGDRRLADCSGEDFREPRDATGPGGRPSAMCLRPMT